MCCLRYAYVLNRPSKFGHPTLTATSKMAFAVMRNGLRTSAANRYCKHRPGLAGLTKTVAYCDRAALSLDVKAYGTTMYSVASVQSGTGRKPLMTASTPRREHAETDKLDQKDLTRQKG